MRQRKDEFFGTFDRAVSNLLTTVEENYLEVCVPVLVFQSYVPSRKQMR